jgi:hypothetical protein
MTELPGDGYALYIPPSMTLAKKPAWLGGYPGWVVYRSLERLISKYLREHFQA